MIEEGLTGFKGSQPRANVTYEIIGAWYRKMATAGFTDLSYFNVNEYGINIVLPPLPRSVAARAILPVVDAAYTKRLFARVSRLRKRPQESGDIEPVTCGSSWYVDSPIWVL